MRVSDYVPKVWQRRGLYAAVTALALMVLLELLDRTGWWYQETLWYGGLMWLNYPPSELQRLVLNELQIPRIYDIPLSVRELVVIKATQWVFAIVWWFVLGAAVSTVWRWLTGNRRGSLRPV
jgi:hypothetical protein